MEQVNKYCINLNIKLMPDVVILLQTAQDSHAGQLHVFKQFQSMKYAKSFDDYLKPFNVSICKTEIFYTPPGHVMPIHSDTPDLGKNHTKINWVFGDPGHKMYWWKPRDGVKLDQTPTDVGMVYTNYNMEDCDLLWTAEAGCPSMVNVGIPHNVYNSTKRGRWNISFTILDNDTNEILQWDKAEKVFASLAQG